MGTWSWNAHSVDVGLGLGIILLAGGPLAGAQPSSDWRAGVARVDTTPAAPVWMSGYASRSTPSQGVAHPLYAKALALVDARRPEGRLRHLRHHRLQPRLHRSRRRTGQGEVRSAAGKPRPVRVALSLRPDSERQPRPLAGQRRHPRGGGEQRRLHPRARRQDRRPGRRGARQDGAGQPELRHRPRALRPEPPREDRQRLQAWQEPRRTDR